MEEKTHWLQSPNKNYMGHWDLPEGKDLVLTIESAKWEVVKNPIINTSESKRVIRFKEKNIKPMICNQTNANSILKSTGIKYMEDCGDKKIALFTASIMDRRTKEDIDCIRIRTEGQLIKQKPEMNPSHSRWDGAKKAISEGSITVADIIKSYTLSKENEELICSK